MDPYKILEVSDHASDEVIEAAYKTLVKLNHRDELKLQKLNDAKGMVTGDKRRRYDGKAAEVKKGTLKEGA